MPVCLSRLRGKQVPRGHKRSGGTTGGKLPGAGRPTNYTPEMVDRICNELMAGKSLIKICEAEDMPHRVTVINWLGMYQDFATRYSKARESQADYMDDLILDTANASDPESAPADRVKIDAYKWRAARLQPKKYGDRVHKELSGPDGNPIKLDVTGMTDEQLAALEAALSGSTDGEGRTASGDTSGKGKA